MKIEYLDENLEIKETDRINKIKDWFCLLDIN